MFKKIALAASVIVIGLGTITPAMAGGSHGNRHFRVGHHGGHHGGHGVGYALLGFGLGYALYSASRPRYNYYYDPSYYYAPPRYRAPVVYAPPPQYEAQQPSQSVQEFPAGTTCLQTREYTTVITIAGEEQEAYGTACLLADGSWIAGAPKFVPSVD